VYDQTKRCTRETSFLKLLDESAANYGKEIGHNNLLLPMKKKNKQESELRIETDETDYQWID
jgi:hypothetical protein